MNIYNNFFLSYLPSTHLHKNYIHAIYQAGKNSSGFKYLTCCKESTTVGSIFTEGVTLTSSGIVRDGIVGIGAAIIMNSFPRITASDYGPLTNVYVEKMFDGNRLDN